MNTPMTTDEIVIETVRFYLSDVSRFASDKGFCFYVVQHKNENEKNCAVGRCMNPDGKEHFGSFRGGILTVDFYIQDRTPEKSLDDYLLPPYRGHSKMFWSALQTWHDALAAPIVKKKNLLSYSHLQAFLLKENFISEKTLQTLREEFPFEE